MDLTPVGSRPAPSVAVVKRSEGLARVLKPEINVCVWRRTLPPRFERWLAALARTLVHDVSRHVSAAPASTRPLFAGLPDDTAEDAAMIRAWADDVAGVAGRLAALLGQPTVRATLATVVTNKCRKFHSDYKTLRLVCTYAGPGTEWVDDRHVNREAMGHEETCIDAANLHIVPRGSSVRRGGPGDVVILKGELFPGNRGRGAVHRSPPIEATGERRIVLTLDAT